MTLVVGITANTLSNQTVHLRALVNLGTGRRLLYPGFGEKLMAENSERAPWVAYIEKPGRWLWIWTVERPDWWWEAPEHGVPSRGDRLSYWALSRQSAESSARRMLARLITMDAKVPTGRIYVTADGDFDG